MKKHNMIIVERTDEQSPNHPFAKVWIMRCQTDGELVRVNSCDAQIAVVRMMAVSRDFNHESPREEWFLLCMTVPHVRNGHYHLVITRLVR